MVDRNLLQRVGDIEDDKRQDLIAKGVIGHWTDLGEPEMYDPGSGYAAGDQAAAHNIFNARWIRSIHDGYRRNNVERRPFMMSRSGTAGIQRFGAAMWSGDIGSKLENLAAREGAVIPLLQVHGQTLNVDGRRKDGGVDQDLVARVFAFGVGRDDTSAFTLYEDDGVTTAYQQGEVQTTAISQARTDNQITVQVAAAAGSYQGAPDARGNVIELVVDRPVTAVSLDGQSLAGFQSMEELGNADSGWVKAGDGMVIAKSAPAGNRSQALWLRLGEPTCTSDLSSISVPGAGNSWNPADPQRTFTREACNGKVWSGRVSFCNEEYKFAANGAWTVNWGCDGKQDGANCPAQLAGIYQVTLDEDSPSQPELKRIGDAPGCRGLAARFRCGNGHTTFGTSVYVVGNIPELGDWSPEQAVLLSPDGPYPTWTGRVENMPGDRDIEWKCIKRLEDGDRRVVQWEPGVNNRFDNASDVQVGAF